MAFEGAPLDFAVFLKLVDDLPELADLGLVRRALSLEAVQIFQIFHVLLVELLEPELRILELGLELDDHFLLMG